MSNYEGMHGKGVARQTDLRVLRQELQDLYNKTLAEAPASERKRFPKANNRTKSFSIIHHDGQQASNGYGLFRSSPFIAATELFCEGEIIIQPDKGCFQFHVDENNHALESAEQSSLLNHVFVFMNKLPKNGTTYGAETYYWSEYDEDEHGHKAPGTYRYYGSWANLKRLSSRR
jgi:hypothetical protein